LDGNLPLTASFSADRSRAFFAAGHDSIKAGAIAARQLHALRQHYGGKLRVIDVKEMFVAMQDQL
jgi:hypothetical protein